MLYLLTSISLAKKLMSDHVMSKLGVRFPNHAQGMSVHYRQITSTKSNHKFKNLEETTMRSVECQLQTGTC